MKEFTLCWSKTSSSPFFTFSILILADIFDVETNVTINIFRSNLAGNLLPWDGDDWKMSSEIGEDEYQVLIWLLKCLKSELT